MKRVVVLTGGSTPERSVALAGASQVVLALRKQDFEVRVVDTVSGEIDPAEEASILGRAVGKAPPTDADLAELAKDEDLLGLAGHRLLLEADVIFLLLHGRQGEGGLVQTVLEQIGVPFTGSGSVGSLLAMDKDVAKRLMRQDGITTADWVRWPASDDAIERLGFPLVVKPSQVGSTVGLSVVDDAKELPLAVERARHYDDEVLIEAFVSGREMTVGVLGERALAVGEIVPRHRIFDFECKYTEGMAEEIFPALIDDSLAERLQNHALRVHRSLKLRDFSRVDFRVSEDGTSFCLEANTLPGMTTTSLLPQSAVAAGVSFERLCREMVELCLYR